MKYLYIARHASAAASNGKMADFERPLLARGMKEADKVGANLCHNQHKIDLLISSPARRARETAEILAGHLAYPKEKIIYLKILFESPDPEKIMEVLQEADDDSGSVLLCGHNPTLQQLASALVEQFSEPLPAGAIVGIAFNIDEWNCLREKTGKVIYYSVPGK